MDEYVKDVYIQSIKDIILENCYSEDGLLHIKNKLKYDVYNITREFYYNFIECIERELELYEED